MKFLALSVPTKKKQSTTTTKQSITDMKQLREYLCVQNSNVIHYIKVAAAKYNKRKAKYLLK